MAIGNKTGGRKKGSGNKASKNRKLAIAVAGIEPKDFLLNGLAFYNKKIQEELAKGASGSVAEVVLAYGAGKEFAKDAAPYCHPRLAAVEHSGPGKGPIELKDVSDADRVRAMVLLLSKTGVKLT